MEKQPDRIEILYNINDDTYTVITFDMKDSTVTESIFSDLLTALISAQKIQHAWEDVPISLWGFPNKHPSQTTLNI